jgi:protein-L-isoaspartate(D-aspartate) O-methyltransferase
MKSTSRSATEELAAAIRAEDVSDPRVLAAVREVPRAEFVPPPFADRAYSDAPLPIGHGQVTTQPSLVARMVQALELTGRERILEMGTGFGWQTALLARLGASVWSVERRPEFAEHARASLQRLRIENVEIVVGDGTEGIPDHAPYEAIIVSAAFTSVPGPLPLQLAAGGRLVEPLGPGGAEEVVLFSKTGAGLTRRRMLTRAHFVRLCGRHGFPE